MRPPHILKPNKRNEFPRELIFFDTESDLIEKGAKVEHRPYLLVGKYVRIRDITSDRCTSEWYHTDSPCEFWTWVTSKLRDHVSLYLVSHNVGYDIITSQALYWLPQAGYTVFTYYEKGRTFHLTLKNGRRKVHFVNLANYFAGTLAEIGKTFGLEKLSLDYANPDREKALTYCIRDVEIVERAFMEWLKFCYAENLGNFGITAPAQAFNAFRHRFMRHKIYIHNNEMALNLERDGYYGGRVEAFYIGQVENTPIYDLDVNSMYPSVMLENRFPVRLLFYSDKVTVQRLKSLISTGQVMARVVVRTKYPVVPCDLNGTLVFPIGTFETTLATPELELLLRYGDILDVKEVAFYETAPLFADYVSYFYQKRKEAKAQGKDALSLLYKLMLNSLYGKFGQKSDKWRVIGSAPPDVVSVEEGYSESLGRWYTYKTFGGSVLEFVGEDESYNSFPAIAAHVTSFARVRLWYYMLLAQVENVLYCDTDSLFVNRNGLENLNGFLSAEALGMLKVVHAFNNLEIFNLKDYSGDGLVVLKGVPSKARSVGLNRYELEVFPHLATFLRQGNVLQYTSLKSIKTLKRDYRKGWVLKSGKVYPLVLDYVDGNNTLLSFEETYGKVADYELKDPRQENALLALFS